MERAEMILGLVFVAGVWLFGFLVGWLLGMVL